MSHRVVNFSAIEVVTHSWPAVFLPNMCIDVDVICIFIRLPKYPIKIDSCLFRIEVIKVKKKTKQLVFAVTLIRVSNLSMVLVSNQNDAISQLLKLLVFLLFFFVCVVKTSGDGYTFPSVSSLLFKQY